MEISKHQMTVIAKITLISLLPVLLIYLPFALHLQSFWGIPLGSSGMQTIFSNWDGPNYVYNAITFYSKSAIEAKPFLNVPAYYPAHFPALSFLYFIFSPFFGLFWGPILVQLLSGVILNMVFYFFIRNKTKHPLWLTFVFTVFPARYLVVRAVIGPELFLVALTIASLWAWETKKYFVAGIFSFIAVFLKFQALVMPVTTSILTLFYIWKNRKVDFRQFVTPILGFSGFLFVCLYYQVQTGNFFAYFEAQKIVGMSAALPFAMFNFSQKWVGTGWMEAALLYFIAIFITIAKLFGDKKYAYAVFGIVYVSMLALIPQVDIMRLAMPLAPLFFYAFSDLLASKHVRIGLLISLPAIYLFAINFIVTNRAPIIDWSLFR